MISIRSRALLTLAVIVLVAACHADSPVQPSVPPALDDVISEMSLPVVSRSVALPFNGYWNAPPALLSASCSYSAAMQRFDCPSFPNVSPKFPSAQWFMLLDATGAPQSSWSPGTTAAVRLHQTLHWYNTVFLSDSLDVVAEQDLTIGGLLSGQHTLSGSQTAHAEGWTFERVTWVPMLFSRVDVLQQLSK